MYYVNKNIKNLYRIKHQDDRKNVLRLDMNENPNGLPESFIDSVKEKINANLIATYPSKKEITRLIADYNNIAETNVTVTAGSEEAIRLIFQCFGEEKKSVLTVLPTFEMYDVYSLMFGMKHIFAEYNDNFEVQPEDIIKKITEDVSLVVLLNPNSPIGTTFTVEKIEKVIKRANEVGAIVIVDEAYHHFYEGTVVELIKKYNNLIVIRTFSKLCSMAGLRIGYAMADDKLIDYIEKAESTFNVSNLSILFATELLKKPEIIKEEIEKEKMGHEWLYNKLKENKYKVFSGEGNYILFFPNISSEILVNKLKSRDIWIRDYSKDILKGWARISTGELSVMKKAWEIIEQEDR